METAKSYDISQLFLNILSTAEARGVGRTMRLSTVIEMASTNPFSTQLSDASTGNSVTIIASVVVILIIIVVVCIALIAILLYVKRKRENSYLLQQKTNKENNCSFHNIIYEGMYSW